MYIFVLIIGYVFKLDLSQIIIIFYYFFIFIYFFSLWASLNLKNHSGY